MNFMNITVAGCGVLGSQIAYQVAYKGFNVSVYDVSEEAIERGKERMKNWMARYKEELGATEEEVQSACNRITFSCELAAAVEDADLVIEAIPEVAPIKLTFYKELGNVAEEKTIFVTNSSTLLPSQFAGATGRPEKFLSLHFANEIWKNNTAEVMQHPGTDPEVFQAIIEFAKQIGMVALPLHKEQPGYILNSLLVPFLEAAQMLYFGEVADAETIDKTWMLGTGSPYGPFAILDVIGINTVYNIVLAKAHASGDPKYLKVAGVLKTEFIDKGKLGRETGEGFYKYPDPNFMKADFLKV